MSLSMNGFLGWGSDFYGTGQMSLEILDDGLLVDDLGADSDLFFGQWDLLYYAPNKRALRTRNFWHTLPAHRRGSASKHWPANGIGIHTICFIVGPWLASWGILDQQHATCDTCSPQNLRPLQFHLPTQWDSCRWTATESRWSWLPEHTT